MAALQNSLYITPLKKLFDIPVPSRDATYQTLPRREYFIYDVIIPGQGEFGKWHPGWGREYRKAFFTVYLVSYPWEIITSIWTERKCPIQYDTKTRGEAIIWEEILLFIQCVPKILHLLPYKNFRLQVFSWISFPQNLEFPFRPILNFFGNHRDIRSSRCTTGVVDTGGKKKKSSIIKV